jgi:hypothetical protein
MSDADLEAAGARSRPGGGTLRVLSRWGGRPLVVALAVVLVYGLWLAAGLRAGTLDPRDFVHVGRHFATQSAASRAITGALGQYRFDGDIGYDGQMFFYIAVDPINARFYLDDPAYRYSRIVYPLTAGVLAGFDPIRVPWTLLLVNLAMVGAGVLALAGWLRDRGAPPWLAAVFGLYPGVLVAFQRDTSEIMAYGLVAVGAYLAGRTGRERLPLAGAAFGLAVLTRETAGLFALLYAGAVLIAGAGPWPERARVNWRPAALLLALSFLPYVLLKLLLFLWLRSAGLVPALQIQPVPFGGIVSWWPWAPGQVEEVRTVVLPAIIAGSAAAWALLRGTLRPEVWALLLNIVVLVVLLGPGSWVDISSSGRITIGIALAAVMCAGLLARRGWFWASSALWLSPMAVWIVLPTAQYYLSRLHHLHV